MGCIYLKKKLNNTLYCKLHKKQVAIADCLQCNNVIYKHFDTKTLKKVSTGLIEKQKKRFSIIYRDLNFCAVCDLKHVKSQRVDLNEVYEGARRQASMTYGFIIPLCRQCHTRFHNDRDFALKYKRLFQQEFEKNHSRDEFINIIHKSYL